MTGISTASRRTARPWARIACTAGLTVALGLTGTLAPFAQAAYAATPETLAELQQLSDQVAQAAATHSEATARAAELNSQIEEQANEILHIEQDVMPEYRERASEAASRLYKMRETTGNIMTLLFNAPSFSDFITQLKYLDTIQDENVSVLQDLEEASAELSAKVAELSQAKDEAMVEEQRASDALAQVSAAQAQMEQRAASEDAAEAEAARRAADEAAAVQQQMQQQSGAVDATAPVADDGAATDQPATSQPAGDQASEQAPAPEQGSGSEGGAVESAPDTSTDTGSDSSSGWMSGVASHYGTGDGLMGSATASGEPVTESSMCIAMLNVPLGTMVEIRYGGKTVVARVNDRGPYIHGRVIDMQPAVARALGFISVGVGTVEYRIL